MPKRHREGIAMQSPETPIRRGQTWENRWTHLQALVTSPPNEHDEVLLQGVRLRYIRVRTLLRDFVLVDG